VKNGSVKENVNVFRSHDLFDAKSISMKIILSLVFIVSLSLSAFSQGFNGSNQATSLYGGRWEFFMSEIAVTLTFKVDKFTGDVFQLVELKDKTLTWVLIEREKKSNDIQKQDCINYQLFSSGMGIRHTYLLNTNSGLTWQLVKGENEILFFQTIEDILSKFNDLLDKMLKERAVEEKKN
jgi:hypothetical protein